jgi:hypothetical protein
VLNQADRRRWRLGRLRRLRHDESAVGRDVVVPVLASSFGKTFEQVSGPAFELARLPGRSSQPGPRRRWGTRLSEAGATHRRCRDRFSTIPVSRRLRLRFAVSVPGSRVPFDVDLVRPVADETYASQCPSDDRLGQRSSLVSSNTICAFRSPAMSMARLQSYRVSV